MATGTQVGLQHLSVSPDKLPNNYFDGLPVSRIHKILFFIIMLAYFAEQMDNWNFGFIAPALMRTWHLSMADIGRVNFVYFLGMTLGGLCGGVISDFIGRRKTFLGSMLLFSLGSVANGFANSLSAVIVTRAVTGFGIFCLMVCSQAYIAEISPAESRGKWQGLIAAVGFSAVPVIGAVCRLIIPLSPEAWRYIFFMGGFGLIAFVFGFKYLKESPRWLVARKRVPEAEQVVLEITGISVDLSQAAANTQPRESAWETLLGMFSLKYLPRTLVLAFFVILTVPATFVICVWTPTLLNRRGLSVKDSLLASFILMIGVPVGCYIAGLVSDMGGRKIPLAIATTLIAVFSAIFAQVSGFLPIVIVGFLLISSVLASSFICFSYIAESYPTRMRNTAVGIHNATGRFATSFMQLLVPVIFASSGFVGVYRVLAAMVILPVFVVLIWGLRTGGEPLERIA